MGSLDKLFTAVLPREEKKFYGQNGVLSIVKEVDGEYQEETFEIIFLLTNYKPIDANSGLEINGTMIEIYNQLGEYDFLLKLTEIETNSISLDYNNIKYTMSVPKEQNALNGVVQAIINPFNYYGG